jgi:hypothetical protein
MREREGGMMPYEGDVDNKPRRSAREELPPSDLKDFLPGELGMFG